LVLSNDNHLGPGDYENNPGGFNKGNKVEGITIKDSYITNDNGHLNQRPQQYATQKKVMATTVSLRQSEPESPGPG
jgi:hypothetical protein